MNRRMALRLLVLPPLVQAVRAIAQANTPFRVAWVSMDQATSSSPVLGAFRAGMAALGYVDGQNLAVDTWWADGSVERLEKMRNEILQAKPEVIVAQGGVALGPMLHPMVKTPVVFSMSADPVEAKIVSSYARPGGNVTGITLFAAELAAKRMGYLKEVAPGVKTIAVIANPLHPGARRELQAARDAATKLNVTLRYFPAQNEGELDAALAEIAKTRIGAVLVFADGFALGHADRIAAFALKNRIPVAAGWAPFAQSGNLLTYGPEFADVYRRLATYVNLIHKGARPGDLPIEQPTKFELVVNLRTAKALGINIPRSLLLSADEVIE